MKFTKYYERGAYHWELYKDTNDIYHKYVNEVIDWVKERPVLDVGAGDGLITHLLANGQAGQAFGMDNNRTAVLLAIDKGANVIEADIYQGQAFLPFDSVFLGDTIEHLAYWQDALENIKKYLTPKGHLYITTPPAREDRKLQDKHHYFEWTPEEFKDNVESQGFELIEPIETKYMRMFGKFRKV